MFRNMNAQPLLTNERGSVAVEFGLISLVLIFFVVFLVDLVLQQALVGKLDRVTYSMAGTLRERTQLYKSDEYLNQGQVEQIAALSRKVLKDMHSGADLSQLSMMVEELHFKEPKLVGGGNAKEVTRYQSYQVGGQVCQPYTTLNNMQELSPRGSYGRWVPMYQVTLCLPSNSWFSKLTGDGDGKSQQKSFAVVVVR
ncbi:tight adherence pilus pseudopilin TadF [Pragia fontium]|uniref:Tight adherence protein F n=1 Tax=Pragia fontium DSM 5563 = ATCC 49100 TaxID=1122977 RepID=A0AAJ4W8J1_9GAMM|nr:tight adherence pilus pseudopilin TadF [Pragia fontium]SFC13433.1 tight adherence protein F [Pragia fontium DSM 5563 = ATCC 49100]